MVLLSFWASDSPSFIWQKGKEQGWSCMNANLKLLLSYSILNIFVPSRNIDNSYRIIKVMGVAAFHCTNSPLIKLFKLQVSVGYDGLMNTEQGMSLHPFTSFSSILNRKYNLKQNLVFSYPNTCSNICIRWFEISKALTKQVLFRSHNISCL